VPWVWLEPIIPVFERVKTFHALDSAATLMGDFCSRLFNYLCLSCCGRWQQAWQTCNYEMSAEAVRMWYTNSQQFRRRVVFVCRYLSVVVLVSLNVCRAKLRTWMARYCLFHNHVWESILVCRPPQCQRGDWLPAILATPCLPTCPVFLVHCHCYSQVEIDYF
jgi:hypothetical protein